MTGRVFLHVDPRSLKLPPSRREGADLVKLADQISRFHDKDTGMPPILVYRGSQGILMIWDGVTRATRIARLSPGELVPVEVLRDVRSDFSQHPSVEDVLP